MQEAKTLMYKVSEDPKPVHKIPFLIDKSQDTEMRSEPLSTPASPLALGVCVNEIMRRWMSCKTRKNDVCKVSLGFNSAAELARESPGIMSSEPLPLLTITDVNMECIDDVSAEDTVGTAGVSLGVHVCADAATRLPDLLRELKNQFDNEEDYMRQCRSAIFVAASQASFLSAVASSLSSGYTNASVASSKKICLLYTSPSPRDS